MNEKYVSAILWIKCVKVIHPCHSFSVCLKITPNVYLYIILNKRTGVMLGMGLKLTHSSCVSCGDALSCMSVEFWWDLADPVNLIIWQVRCVGKNWHQIWPWSGKITDGCFSCSRAWSIYLSRLNTGPSSYFLFLWCSNQHSTKALFNLCTWMTVTQTLKLISFSGFTDQHRHN